MRTLNASSRRQRKTNSRLVTFFWEFSGRIHPSIISKFGGLEKSLSRASVCTAFKVYVGLMVLTSMVAGVGIFTVSYCLFLLIGFQVLHPLVVPAFVGVLVGASVFVSYYLYPRFVAYTRGGKIDANLSTIANYMAVMASAGMPAENIFRSLGMVGEEFGVDKEVNAILRDIQLMGMDLHSALRKAAERLPSRGFASLVDGIVTTSHMGGDLALYLREEAEKFKRARMISVKHFIDNLGLIAETYIAFMVAAPLMLIIMLSVMSFIGGGVTIMDLDPGMLLNLLTFVFLPGGVGIMMLIVDSMNPQR